MPIYSSPLMRIVILAFVLWPIQSNLYQWHYSPERCGAASGYTAEGKDPLQSPSIYQEQGVVGPVKPFLHWCRPVNGPTLVQTCVGICRWAAFVSNLQVSRICAKYINSSSHLQSGCTRCVDALRRWSTFQLVSIPGLFHLMQLSLSMLVYKHLLQICFQFLNNT